MKLIAAGILLEKAVLVDEVLVDGGWFVLILAFRAPFDLCKDFLFVLWLNKHFLGLVYEDRDCKKLLK